MYTSLCGTSSRGSLTAISKICALVVGIFLSFSQAEAAGIGIGGITIEKPEPKPIVSNIDYWLPKGRVAAPAGTRIRFVVCSGEMGVDASILFRGRPEIERLKRFESFKTDLTQEAATGSIGYVVSATLNGNDLAAPQATIYTILRSLSKISNADTNDNAVAGFWGSGCRQYEAVQG